MVFFGYLGGDGVGDELRAFAGLGGGEAFTLVHAAAMGDFRAAAFLATVRGGEGDHPVGGVGGLVQGEGAGVFWGGGAHEL